MEAPTPKGERCASLLFGKLFPKKIHENKRIWTPRRRTSLADLLSKILDARPSLCLIFFIFIQFLATFGKIIGFYSNKDSSLLKATMSTLANPGSTTAVDPPLLMSRTFCSASCGWQNNLYLCINYRICNWKVKKNHHRLVTKNPRYSQLNQTQRYKSRALISKVSLAVGLRIFVLKREHRQRNWCNIFVLKTHDDCNKEFIFYFIRFVWLLIYSETNFFFVF